MGCNVSGSEFKYGLMSNCHVVYDIETFPNVFCFNYHVVGSMSRHHFTGDNLQDLIEFALLCKDLGAKWVGFNNDAFDYPVVHGILTRQLLTVDHIYKKAMAIIATPFQQRFSNMIYDSDKIVQQIDLYKIHHFDNPARATSLKMLEINMRMEDVSPLPFPIGTFLNQLQKQALVDYCWDDINATELFYYKTVAMIEFREKLSRLYNMNMTNFSDAKIGASIFTHELKKAGLEIKGKTERNSVDLKECVPVYINFEQYEFQRIQAYLESKVIVELKGAFKDAVCTIDGLTFVFGVGGLHASRDETHYKAENDYVIELADVVSYYPSLSIANQIYPEHLGSEVCEIYKRMLTERRKHKKGTMENAAYKLALNSSFGNFGNKYSNLFDNKTLCQITIGGQLSLAMLCEQLMKVPTLTLFNVNTDGVAYHVHKAQLPYVDQILRWWEQVTKLTLETEHYSQFFNLNCNNYLAIETGGGVKAKGAYAYKNLDWNKNHSSLVVQRAVENFLINQVPVESTIRDCGDPFDFLLSKKVQKTSSIFYGEYRIDNIVRYYISTDGEFLTERRTLKEGLILGNYKRANKLTDNYYNAVMVEIGNGVWDERIHTKNRSVYESSTPSSINAGFTCLLANHVKIGEQLKSINYDWYITEAKKLIDPFILIV